MGVAVGVIGIILAVVTIGSHRAHTASVIVRTEANDQWAFYQAKKLREHLLDVGASLASGLASEPSRVQPLVEKFHRDRDRYTHDAEEIQRQAKAKEDESLHQERRALLLDIGEGFLELGLVLSSLYFLSKRRFFPVTRRRLRLPLTKVDRGVRELRPGNETGGLRREKGSSMLGRTKRLDAVKENADGFDEVRKRFGVESLSEYRIYATKRPWFWYRRGVLPYLASAAERGTLAT